MTDTRPPDGRTRRKVSTMRRVQDEALRLFERRGFDGVTVDDVAKAADVGVASIFRNFGTKEQLVLWDEYDPLLFEAVARHLADLPPLEAMSAGVREALGAIYEDDRRRVLRRADLIAKTPALQVANLAGLHALREGLDRVLRPAIADPLERELVSAVFGATLAVCVERWRKERARRSLETILQLGFEHVARLG